MTERRTYLDVGVGETRGVVTLDGRPERLLIRRDDDLACQALGAEVVGRVRKVERQLALAFIDLGEGGGRRAQPAARHGPAGRRPGRAGSRFAASRAPARARRCGWSAKGRGRRGSSRPRQASRTNSPASPRAPRPSPAASPAPRRTRQRPKRWRPSFPCPAAARWRSRRPAP
ncbi:MAG: hypothetical protein WDM85_12770 [Caulobacteraceae bacterium]